MWEGIVYKTLLYPKLPLLSMIISHSKETELRHTLCIPGVKVSRYRLEWHSVGSLEHSLEVPKHITGLMKQKWPKVHQKCIAEVLGLDIERMWRPTSENRAGIFACNIAPTGMVPYVGQGETWLR